MTTVEPEPPELVAKNLAVGVRLWAGATTFAFFCPFFAYFYLRSLDAAGRWRSADIDPPQGLGPTVMLLIVLAFASAPLYAGYADLPSRPGGISAFADQHVAAGIMWGVRLHPLRRSVHRFRLPRARRDGPEEAMSVVIADFETGAILSWALPLAVLLGICLGSLASLWRRAGRP